MKQAAKKTSYSELLGISEARSLEAEMKAKLITGILAAIKKAGTTHAELAKLSGLPRSAVTGILSGSLQKITIDRILRLVEAVGLTLEVKLKKAA